MCIRDRLYSKLTNAGLVKARESCELGQFIDSYIERRKDAKESTIKKWKSAKTHLVAFFGETRELRSINAGHSDEFRSYLYGQDHAENTARRYCGIAKQFFRAAMRSKLIEENPFIDQVAAIQANCKRR